MLMAISLTLLLFGCSGGGGGDDPTPVPTPMPTSEPTATPTPSTQLGAVVWSTSLDADGAPTEELTAMPRDTDVIYAVVRVDTATAGDALDAVWALDEVPIDAIASSVTIDEAAAAGWVSFSLTWEGESLWPLGTLAVTITATSGASTSGTIQIQST
jgi:hypothetical protein